jgi:hypothetical protein
MPISSLIPSIDRRLSAWIEVRDRQGAGPALAPRPAITIAREFGCEAYPLAERLCEALAARTKTTWTVFDKTLIERVSRETHLSERLLSSIGDASRVLDMLASTIPGWQTHAEAYQTLAGFIVRIAQEGNAIIVGRGGAVVTEGMPNCYHFRLVAPREHRVVSIQQRLGITRDDAETLVREEQDRRERFLEEFLHCSIADTRFYHAIFNTSRTTVERVTESILGLLPFASPRQLP